MATNKPRRRTARDHVASMASIKRAIDEGRGVSVGELFPELAPDLPKHVGDTSAIEMFDLGLLFRAPATWLHRPSMKFEGLSDAGLADVLDSLSDMLAVTELSMSIVMLQRPGVAAVLVAGLVARLRNEEAAGIVRKFLDRPPEKQLPAGALNAAIFTGGVFEERAEAWIRTIHTVAESTYLPLLVSVFDLKRAYDGRPPEKWGRRLQLGDVMHEARQEWATDNDMLSLLHYDVLRVRNAHAHVNGVELDVPNERVSFVTAGRGRRADRRIGPLSIEQLAEIGGKLFSTFLGVRGAFQLIMNDNFLADVRAQGLARALIGHVKRTAGEGRSDELRK